MNNEAQSDQKWGEQPGTRQGPYSLADWPHPVSRIAPFFSTTLLASQVPPLHPQMCFLGLSARDWSLRAAEAEQVHTWDLAEGNKIS